MERRDVFLKILKKVPAIAILLIVMILFVNKFKWAINAYDAMQTMQSCNFTAECHIQNNGTYIDSVLQAAGMEDNTGFIKGQFCNGILYAEVYPNKDVEKLITKIFADQTDCLVNVSPIAENIFELIEKKTGLSFSSLKKFDSEQYVSLQKLSGLFSYSDATIQIPEIDWKKIIPQLKTCSVPEKTYYASNGYRFYEYGKSGNLIGIKKESDKNYAIYFFSPGKVETVIQYSYVDSLENVRIPEPSITNSALEIWKLILQKIEKRR
ncbi:MAG: hypothetical protein K2L07_13275 [Lachnospiraceae bacterium]|nr:hypothetical protein [Lachnospiraceae bacterium]